MRELVGSAWLFVKRVMAGAVVGVTISDRFGSVATMHGGSMEPTLHPGGNEPFGYLKADLLYLDKLSLRNYNNFVRGDVVVFRSPLEPKMWLVKRLIALQGDWVTVPGTYEILQVPKGHCWVEGDNAEVSLDSKSFGPVSCHLYWFRAFFFLYASCPFEIST
jgi:inner membrane protease subunit 2